MTKQLSFSKYKHEVLPDFRQKINTAESAEDVKKFFVYTVQRLFGNIFDQSFAINYEDVALHPLHEPHYSISQRLLGSKDFSAIWNGSDLPHILAHLAEASINRYKHIEKHPEKTVAKIRM